MVEQSMIGRSAELDRLLSLVDSASEGPLQVALVRGEAGIGKSRLVTEVLDRARSQGYRILFAAARELEHSLPFAALAEALGLRTGVVDEEQAELSRLLVGETGVARSPAVTAEPPLLRLRLLEGVVNLMERYSSRHPVVICVEDLHWADPDTLLGLEHMARRLFAQPIALLGTYRAAPRRIDLERWVGSLAERGGMQISLGPLERDDVFTLVERAVGAPPGPMLMHAAQAAGGNPLFVTELVSALQGEEAIDISTGHAETREHLVPPPLRLLILRQLGALPYETIEVLRVASILGSTFSASDLSVVLGQPASALAGPLVEAFEAGVLGEANGDLRFRHQLVREAIYLDFPASVRRGLHLQAGRALAQVGAETAVVATHLSLGASVGDAEAIDWLRRAGAGAARRAPSVAVDLLRRAYDLSLPSDSARDFVLCELVASLAWSAQLHEAQLRAREVLAASVSLDVQKGLRVTLAEAMMAQGRVHDARLEMAQLLERLPDKDADRGRIIAFDAWIRLFSGDLFGGIAQAETALTDSTELGDEAGRCVALCGLSIAAYLRGDIRLAIELGSDALGRVVLDPTRHLDRYPARLFLGKALFEADRYEEADQVIREGFDRSISIGVAVQATFYHTHLGLHDFLMGQWDDAVAELEAAIAVADEQQPGAAILPRSLLGLIAIHRNQLAAAEAYVAAAEREHDGSGSIVGIDMMRWARVLLRESCGDPHVSGTVASTWEIPEARASADLVLLGPDVVRLALAVGLREMATSVVAAVERAATLNSADSWRAAALRCRGLLDMDPDRLAESVAAYRAARRTHQLAAACEDAATVLAHVGRADEAIALLTEALETHERHGAARDIARVEATLRRLGVRRGRRGTRQRARTGWESLTPTELEVVRHVADGLTNAEIGQRLFISRRTVETHLVHVFAKLGVDSRVRLAGVAARRDRYRPA